MFGFETSDKGLISALDQRRSNVDPLFFGNNFLNDALTGIYKDDLIILTARTGAGKTEIATQIAADNVALGKRVHLFALEAYRGEIEMRILYKTLSQTFFLDKDRSNGDFPNFQEWVYNKQKDLLEKYEREAVEEFTRKFKTLSVYYRKKDFNIETFESQMSILAGQSDLVIIDHLHYFDFGDEENKEIRKTVKQIRDLTTFYRVPTILVAHIRKQDKRFQSLVPDLEDIYGSSDISKIATKIITAAPANLEQAGPAHIFPTYVKVLKNRTDGSRSTYTALCGFNIQKNNYEDEYQIGRISADGKFKALEELPRWAKHATGFIREPSRGNERPSLFESRNAPRQSQFKDD